MKKPENDSPTKELADYENLSALPEVFSLMDIGKLFYQHGWSRGTSSNYSCVLSHDPLRLLITASGKDKRNLESNDFLVVDSSGQPVFSSGQKPSAETLLHVVAANLPGTGAVLHTHSVWSTVLSDHFEKSGGFFIEGYEMLKGLRGIQTHEEKLWVEIFPNSQDIAGLSARVLKRLADSSNPLRYGYLILRHGLYTWGKDLDEARRHVEIFEFLFEVLARKLSISGPTRCDDCSKIVR